MAKHRAFGFSPEAEKVLEDIKEFTDESYVKIVEKGLYYYAKHLQRESTKKRAPKTLLDLDLNNAPKPNQDAPFTLNVKGLDTYGSKQRKRWTKSDVKQLLKMRDEGKSLSEMAEYLGRPKSSISKKLWEVKEK